MPGFLFDKGCPLRQKAQRSHSLFQCGQECICGFGFQKFMCDMVDDGTELLFGLRGERDSIFLHGSDLRAEPGKGFVQRGRFSAPGLVQAGLHHGVKFVTAQSITGGEPGGQVQRKWDAVPQDDLTVRHINEDRNRNAKLRKNGFGLLLDLWLDAGSDICGFADIKIASYCFYCTTMYCNAQYDRRKRKARFVPLRRMCYTVLKDTVENEVQI